MSAETVLGYWSGLALVAPPLPLGALAGTMLALHICDAIVCRLVAHNHGRPKAVWTALGLIGGIWALAVVILLPRRDGAPPPQGRLR